MPELNEAQERAEFEAEANAARFFPRKIDFTMTKSPSGRDEYANAHLQSRWKGWLAARRASSAQQVEAVSIDTPEFNALAARYGNSKAGKDYMAMVAHIDARLRQAATGSADGLDAKRYRLLREAKWFAAGFAKTEPNASAFHYSGELLDQMVDAAILAQQGADKP